MTERICKNCAYFYNGDLCGCTSGVGSTENEYLKEVVSDNPASTVGQCRRYPPHPVVGAEVVDDGQTHQALVEDYQFPLVTGSMWCGEWCLSV